MKQALSKLLPRAPRKINEHNWFYIELKGISLIHETWSNNGWVHTDEVLILWVAIEKALADLEKAKFKHK
jgi:hypothetical protein